MVDDDNLGPEVPDKETLYRFVTVSSFWVKKEKRPSSSLFDNPPRVSVNIASMTTKEECEHQLREDLRHPEGGMVSFNCGMARDLGFDARHEPEGNNQAHAHLYCDEDHSNKQRKRNALKLALECAVVIDPKF